MPRSVPWLRGRYGILLCGLLASLAISACSRSPVAEPPRILLIGLDGADLRMLDRLSAEGRVPSLAQLMREGVSAPLETVSNASPVVWTSIATGVLPEKHGIRSFVRHGQPVASTMRQRPAFWNILSHYGHSVGVLGWWATFPAERVRGYVVSPYIVFRPPRPGKAHVEKVWREGRPRRTYPPDLHGRIAPYMETAEDIDRSEIGDVFADDVRTTQTPWSVARDQSYEEIAQRMMETQPVETLAVYFQGIDVASHDLSRDLYGRNVNLRRKPRVGPDEVRAAMQRVDAMYDRVDGIVGDLLERVSDATDVIVVSDHGWEYDGTGHLNHNPGIFIAAGPSFRSDEREESISVLDVLPLLLSILDVPLSRRLDGEVPAKLLAPGVDPAPTLVDRYPIAPVSLDPGVQSRAPEDDRQMLERLRGLGYLDGGRETAPPAGSRGAPTP